MPAQQSGGHTYLTRSILIVCKPHKQRRATDGRSGHDGTAASPGTHSVPTILRLALARVHLLPLVPVGTGIAATTPRLPLQLLTQVKNKKRSRTHPPCPSPRLQYRCPVPARLPLGTAFVLSRVCSHTRRWVPGLSCSPLLLTRVCMDIPETPSPEGQGGRWQVACSSYKVCSDVGAQSTSAEGADRAWGGAGWPRLG